MAKQALTVEDLWNLPRVGTPEPSPDGSRLVVPVTRWNMNTDESSTRLWLLEPGRRGGGLRPLTREGGSASTPRWDPSGRRLLYLRKPEEEAGNPNDQDQGPRHPDKAQVYLMNMQGGEPERLTDLPLGVADIQWFPDGGRIALLAEVIAEDPSPEGTARLQEEREEEPMKVEVTEDRVYRYWDRWLTRDRYHHIFVLDLESGELQDLLRDSRRWFNLMDPTDQFRISPDGSEIAFCAIRSRPPHDPALDGSFLVPVPRKISAKGRAPKVKPLWKGHTGDTYRPVYSPDGRWLLYGYQEIPTFYADRVRLMLVERSTGRKTALNTTWDRSAGGYAFSRDSKEILIRAEDEARTSLFRLNLKAALADPEQTHPTLLARGGGYGPFREAAGRLFTTYSTLTRPAEVHAVRLADGRRKRLSRFTEEEMKGLPLGEVEERTFRGAGEDRVQMYLVWPPGARPSRKKDKPRKRLPLVHVIHGGPHGISGDEWHWRWNPQIFATAGYLVAMVNFHGSTSWGQEFAKCIQGRWGDQPYQDIMAATDSLVEAGIVDPKRMAATGASYGGYLVSWIASQTDRFACIVNHAGVCDFQTQLGSDITQGDEEAMGGTLWDDIEGMDRWNPLRQASGFRSPMLVLHGEMDYRVPYYQGLQIYNVYKMRKLPARLVVYPDQNHWILKPRAHRHWYGEVLDWIERWFRKGSSGGRKRR